MMHKLLVSLIGMFVFCSAWGGAPNAWTTTGSLNTARYTHTGTLLQNGKVLVTGGYNASSSYLNSAELYDPATGVWTVVAPMSNKRGNHTATLLPNGKVLVAGGSNGSDYLTSVEVYDPVYNAWTAVASMNNKRSYHTATLLPNGKVLVAGGYDILGNYNSSIASAEIYDPVANAWTVVASMSTEHTAHTATLLPSGLVLVSGGVNTSNLPIANAELYNMTANTWMPIGSLNTVRVLHTAVLLPKSGLVLAVGGNSIPITASAELYNATSGQWNNTGSMGTARVGHISTLLLNDKVMVNGGTFSGTSSTNSTELYDSASAIWSNTGSMSYARTTHTSTLLPNGQVLVVGGRDSSSNALSSCELYYSASSLQIMEISGGSANVTSGGTSQPYLVTGLDSYGNVLMPFGNANVTWSVGAPGDNGTATINGSGIATGGKNGMVTIMAISGLVNATKTLSVAGGIGPLTSINVAGNSSVASGDKVIFVATGLDIYGNPISGLTFVWSAISGTGTATINSAGVATGSGVGTVTIQAASGGKTGTAPLNVTVGALASINITGGSTSVASGSQTPAFNVNGYDAYGNIIAPKPTVTWSTGAPGDIGTASIDSNGVVTGERDGTVTIKATSGGITGTTILNVTGSYGGITSVAVTGGATSIPTGAQTPAFIAKALDIYNNTITGATFTWTTGDAGDTGTATIDASSGIATGGNVGKVTVKATSGSETGTAELDVTVAPITPVDQASSPTGAIVGGTVGGVAAVAIVTAAVTYWFKKYRSVANPIASPEEGVTKESTIITTEDGGLALMTVSIKELSK